MSLFEFTFALSAVILGLALTHIAATVHKLLLAGKRIQWAIEPVLLTCIVLLVIVSVWLGAWSDKEEAAVTLWQMVLQVAKLLILYIAAASCLPEPDGISPINLQQYYNDTRLLSFGALILSYFLFQIYAAAIEGEAASITVSAAIDWFLYPAIYTSLIFIRARWFNILVLGFALVFYGWEIGDQRLTA